MSQAQKFTIEDRFFIYQRQDLARVLFGEFVVRAQYYASEAARTERRPNAATHLDAVTHGQRQFVSEEPIEGYR